MAPLAEACGLSATPATKNCAAIYSRKRHVLIGISPFNSRFSDEYVTRLIRWAAATFESFDVLLAGDESALQLEAIGTPEGKARYKARRAVRRNRRSVDEALRQLGPTPPDTRVVSISDFADDPTYRKFKAAGEEAFRADTAFRSSCLEMAQKAILGRLRTVHGSTEPVSESQAAHAAEYVLAELPFFLETPTVLGVEESLLAYHQPWKLGEQIFAGRFSIAAHPAQGYLTVTETL
ncbi:MULTISPECIES: tRNA-dependent cyclodipeptide synthase [unclassified Streptomyces]|uniref:tRNA-dependent cyclodipeptide synthase n=1 Tax=unclassified Streptomyces TaxID=2593676 RepID=UPI0018F3414E|nr:MULTISPECIES: tRNA-dependent cyclodipeptide synthase [unclassified Streptomyces]